MPSFTTFLPGINSIFRIFLPYFSLECIDFIDFGNDLYLFLVYSNFWANKLFKVHKQNLPFLWRNLNKLSTKYQLHPKSRKIDEPKNIFYHNPTNNRTISEQMELLKKHLIIEMFLWLQYQHSSGKTNGHKKNWDNKISIKSNHDSIVKKVNNII